MCAGARRRGDLNITDIGSAISTIPEWQASDFKTGQPFEWLYQFRENKFAMAQLREEVKERAGALGVKNFITLWNAFLETKKAQINNGLSCNETEFTDQPLQLLCGEYQCDDYGVTAIDKYGFEIIVCTHPIMPIQRLVNIDTREVKIELAFRRGENWRTIITDKTTIASAQKIISLAAYDIAVDSENAREFVKYLSTLESLNYNIMPETHSVGRLGWIKHYGFSPYVDNLRFDGELSFRTMFDAITEKGNFEIWRAYANEVRANSVIARLVFASSFASVLVEPCNALPFFTHMWGGTGAGKTLMLMLAASVWANPAAGEYIHSFNSTAVGQEMAAGFCNSLPLCIDELQVVKDRKSFDNTIYQLTEGVGRARGAKSGGLQKLSTWRNCIITTGEMPITNANSGGGAVSRVIDLDCKDQKIFESPREVAAIIQSNYGFAGKMFINSITTDGTMNKIRTLYHSLARSLSSSTNENKQHMAAALILAADQLSEEFIFKDGLILSADDITPYLVTNDDIDVNRRAYNWLLDFIAANSKRFTVTDNGGEIWGVMDDDYIYFNKSIFDAKLSDAGYNSTAFLSWARRNKIIDISKDGKSTVPRRINGVLTRCVYLIRQTPDENTENFVDITHYDDLPL